MSRETPHGRHYRANARNLLYYFNSAETEVVLLITMSWHHDKSFVLKIPLTDAKAAACHVENVIREQIAVMDTWILQKPDRGHGYEQAELGICVQQLRDHVASLPSE